MQSEVKILPVIHYLDDHTTLTEATLAFDAGADGVFLISHGGQDEALYMPAAVIKGRYKHKLVGMNLLATDNMKALDCVKSLGLDMLWMDAPGVSSQGATDQAKALVAAARNHHKPLMLFGSVAFKYQPEDPNPPSAALRAVKLGMIPTTSGVATGQPPTVEKISDMRDVIGPTEPLAVASGITPKNVGLYAPLLSHILVSTGVSMDEYHLDVEKLSALIGEAKQSLVSQQA
jgi:predicted TIM-barrel enzyme